MATKELQTRIALKYDSYANWTDTSKEGKGGNLVLLPGEIGICEVPANSNAATNEPTVLFKVGGERYTEGEKAGQLKAFKDLTWASALAADVYDWAKAATVEFADSKIYFKNATGTTVKTLDLTSFAIKSEVKETTDDLTSRLEAIEAKFGGDSDDTVDKQLEAIADRLGVIEGEGEGSVAKAEADAKAYTDEVKAGLEEAIATAKTGAEKTASDALAGQVEAQKAKDEAQDAKIGENTTAIGTLRTDFEAADKVINDKIGELPSDYDTIVAGIADAKQAGIDAAATVADNLATTDGKVTKNTEDVATLRADLTAETTNRTERDSELGGRLEAVEAEIEAFFDGAARDGEGVQKALDTLVEIQQFIDTDGTAASDLLQATTDNAAAIEDIKAHLGIDTEGDAGLIARVDQAETEIEATKGRVTNLEKVTAGYTTEGEIKADVDAAQDKAEEGVTKAEAAQDAADKAQGDVDTLAAAVNNNETGLAKTYEKAAANIAAIEALTTRVGAAETDIDNLQAIVSGDNTNDKLRADITELQGIVVNGDDANVELRGDLNTLTGRVDSIEETVGDDNSGLVKDVAYNAAAIEDIKADYLKESDLFIINCGSSTEVIHTAE